MKKAPPMRGVARWGRPSRPDVARHEQRDALLNSSLRRSAWEAPTRWRTDEVASALLLDLMYRSLVRQEASLTASAGHPVVRTPRLDGSTTRPRDAPDGLTGRRRGPSTPPCPAWRSRRLVARSARSSPASPRGGRGGRRTPPRRAPLERSASEASRRVLPGQRPDLAW